MLRKLTEIGILEKLIGENVLGIARICFMIKCSCYILCIVISTGTYHAFPDDTLQLDIKALLSETSYNILQKCTFINQFKATNKILWHIHKLVALKLLHIFIIPRFRCKVQWSHGLGLAYNLMDIAVHTTDTFGYNKIKQILLPETVPTQLSQTACLYSATSYLPDSTDECFF